MIQIFQDQPDIYRKDREELGSLRSNYLKLAQWLSANDPDEDTLKKMIILEYELTEGKVREQIVDRLFRALEIRQRETLKLKLQAYYD